MYKTRYGKKHYKKRKLIKFGPRPVRFQSPKSVTVRAATAAPEAAIVKLKYSKVGTLSTVMLTEQISIRGNGPFDPEEAAGGGQPVGYDQWKTMFLYYDCYAAHCKVTFIPTTNTVGNANMLVGIIPTTDQSTAFSKEDLVSQPFAKWMTGKALYGSGPDQSVECYMTTRKMFGLTYAQGQSSHYESAVSAVPVRQWFFEVVFASLDGASAPDGQFVIEVTYYTRFYGRQAIYDS